MEYIKCVLCGKDEVEPLYKAKDPVHISNELYSAVRCNNCSIVFLNPRPTKDEIQKFYHLGYYGEKSFYFKTIFRWIISFLYILRVKKIEVFKKGGKVLDIGCGDGKFLAELQKRKWEVYGVDFSEAASKLVNKKLNIFIKKELQECQFPNDYFDLVTLWHVFEHIPNPHELLSEIKRIIKKDGVLLLALPNIESLEAKISKRKWFHLDLPRHLYHYSPLTIRKILEKTGFQIIKITHFTLEYNLCLIQSMINIICPEVNFLYNLVKKNIKYKLSLGIYLYSLFISFFVLIFLSIPLIIISYLFSLLKRGGTIEVYCKRVS